jgi:hypothetical protein
MIKLRLPISADRTPVAAATDVFPTPPFPAKKMILNGKLLCEESASGCDRTFYTPSYREPQAFTQKAATPLRRHT